MVESQVPFSSSAIPPRDEGLRCIHCQYNLTGLTGSICPECGRRIDWDQTRAYRNQEIDMPATYWDRWPWYLKPVGFVATAMKVCFFPRQFARDLPPRPHLLWALAYGAICFGIFVGVLCFLNYDKELAIIWSISVVAYFFLQWELLASLLGSSKIKHPYRFWLAVSCYTSWPLIIEVLVGGPPFFDISSGSIVAPLSFLQISRHPLLLISSLLYYVWWLDWVLIIGERTFWRNWMSMIFVWFCIVFLTGVAIIFALVAHIFI